MTSVNQINAQIKLTEMWKASKIQNYPIKMDKHTASDESRATRATTRGDLLMKGSTFKSQSTFLNDASKIWNKAPMSLKCCETIYSAKKEIKKFIANLPI